MKRALIAIALIVGFLGMVTLPALPAASFAAESSDRYDTTITAAVKAKLAKDTELKTMATIEVNTTEGVVTLAGHVPTAHDKEMAAKVAKEVDGVKKVNNELQVEMKPTKSQ